MRLRYKLGLSASSSNFSCVTVSSSGLSSHAQVLAFAESVGGKILKPAQSAEWGGHSGYFADPDGYPWEVAFNPNNLFAGDGTIWGSSLGPMPE